VEIYISAEKQSVPRRLREVKRSAAPQPAGRRKKGRDCCFPRSHAFPFVPRSPHRMARGLQQSRILVFQPLQFLGSEKSSRIGNGRTFRPKTVRPRYQMSSSHETIAASQKNAHFRHLLNSVHQTATGTSRKINTDLGREAAGGNARNRSRRNRIGRRARQYGELSTTRAGQDPQHFRPNRPYFGFLEPTTRRSRSCIRQLKTGRLALWGSVLADQTRVCLLRHRVPTGCVGREMESLLFDCRVHFVNANDLIHSPVRIASAGIPNMTELASSCASTQPRPALTAWTPCAPSFPSRSTRHLRR